jgi:hypothetical protein
MGILRTAGLNEHGGSDQSLFLAEVPLLLETARGLSADLGRDGELAQWGG